MIERNLNSTKVYMYMSSSRKVSSVAAFCVWIRFRDRDVCGHFTKCFSAWTAAFYAFARVSSPGLYLPSPRACSDSTPAIKHNAIGVQRSTFVHCIIDPVSLTIAKVLLAAGGVGVAVSIKDENNLSIGARVASGLTGAPADKAQSWYDATAYDGIPRYTRLWQRRRRGPFLVRLGCAAGAGSASRVLVRCRRASGPRGAGQFLV